MEEKTEKRRRETRKVDNSSVNEKMKEETVG